MARAATTQRTEAGSTAQPTAGSWKDRVVERSLGKATLRSLDRGHAFIGAALVLLDRSNGDGFKVEDVAEEAGESVRCFYRHFASKDDLLLAVLEEAMERYAASITAVVEPFDEPLDRLAAALFGAVRLPHRNKPGVNVGLSRLHLKLAEVDPAKVGAAREPVSFLMRSVVEEAARADVVDALAPEASAYMLMALTATHVLNQTLGNEFGLRMPTDEEHVAFCLHGLNATLPSGWPERFRAVGQ
ncbi:MAG TPA: TetR/AcrR family transcriptional regulator [Acidimicrobiia bacterium]|nr:TetR/AcrR family transcriptional regulator [Acidimicrobiia bacterium]